jgi:DNA-binding beta-propeller fold protein YncE
MSIFMRIAVLAASLALVPAFAEDVPNDPCDKNHFILKEPVPCPAIQVTVGAPRAIVADAEGRVYFSTENSVFRLDSAGYVIRVAGNGRRGFSGDGGPAVEAQLAFPSFAYDINVGLPYDDAFTELVGALALDRDGNLYVADAYNARIRKIGSNGIIQTISGGGDGTEPAFWSRQASAVHQYPQGVAVGDDGSLFVSDLASLLRRFEPDGALAIAIGENCGDGDFPGVCIPRAMTGDGRGGAYFANAGCSILHVDADGTLGYVARDLGECGNPTDGTSWTGSDLGLVEGLAVDGAGSLVVADTSNHCIRKIDAAGMIATVAGRCGSLEAGYSGDGGDATQARLHSPYCVAIGAGGTILIADTGNRRIRAITPDGRIRTIAGNGN